MFAWLLCQVSAELEQNQRWCRQCVVAKLRLLPPALSHLISASCEVQAASMLSPQIGSLHCCTWLLKINHGLGRWRQRKPAQNAVLLFMRHCNRAAYTRSWSWKRSYNALLSFCQPAKIALPIVIEMPRPSAVEFFLACPQCILLLMDVSGKLSYTFDNKTYINGSSSQFISLRLCNVVMQTLTWKYAVVSGALDALVFGAREGSGTPLLDGLRAVEK